MTSPVQKRPEGFHTVNPYLVAADAAKVIEFLKQTFDAQEVGEPFKGPDGKIMHATVRIGKTTLRADGQCQGNQDFEGLPSRLPC